jgi:hypothetical protein
MGMANRWECRHRLTETGNLVLFRVITAGLPNLKENKGNLPHPKASQILWVKTALQQLKNSDRGINCIMGFDTSGMIYESNAED